MDVSLGPPFNPLQHLCSCTMRAGWASGFWDEVHLSRAGTPQPDHVWGRWRESWAALLRPEVWPSRLGTGAHELPKSLLAGTDQNRQRDGKRLNGEDRATGQGSRGHGGQSVGGVTRWMGPAFRGLEVSARPLCPAFPAKALGMWPEPGSSSIKHSFWGTHVVGLGPAPCGVLSYTRAFSAASPGQGGVVAET